MTIAHVGWGGKTITVESDLNMGRGSFRNVPAYGLRKAIWDAAFGYISGFSIRSITYYVLTRSLSPRIWHYAFFREVRLGYIKSAKRCGGRMDRRTGEVVWCPKCHEAKK